MRQELIKLGQLRKANKIVSPIDGEVQQLAVHTIGGVLQPAQALMVIVPENPKLEVEVLLENKDIGFVREGQSVEIKIDAFPYTKYGLIDGEVSNISRDSLKMKNRVCLSRPHQIATNNGECARQSGIFSARYACCR